MVISRGIGRKDYTGETFRTAPPSQRAGQGILYFNSNFDASGMTYSTLTTTTTPSAGTRWVIYVVTATLDGNTLCRLHLNDVDGSYNFATEYGYGKVTVNMPNGYVITAGNKMSITFYNYSAQYRNIRWHFEGIIEVVD